MTTLADSLQTMASDVISNADEKWVIFIQDYIEEIKTNAIILTITTEIIDRYRYKFEHLMRDNRCPINYVWIARLINHLEQYEDFANKTFVYIPDIVYITNLYRKYRTSLNLS